MPRLTPIIGQRFLEVDIPALYRKIPEGSPLPLAGLFCGDKEQMDRIEAKLYRLLAAIHISPESEAPAPKKITES